MGKINLRQMKLDQTGIIASVKANGELGRRIRDMGLVPGTKMQDIEVDVVFIGSCTNGRIEDLRAAASVVEGKTVSPTVDAMIVPGSGLVKEQAEAEGLGKVVLAGDFGWRGPGCSRCLAMNDDRRKPGERCASTSNRNSSPARLMRQVNVFASSFSTRATSARSTVRSTSATSRRSPTTRPVRP